jgi:hypothetical protein
MGEESGDNGIFYKSREGSAARKNNQIDSLRESENLDNVSNKNSSARNPGSRKGSETQSNVPKLPSIHIRKPTEPIIEESL